MAGTSSTGAGAWRSTPSATLPYSQRPRPERPWVVITIRSAPRSARLAHDPLAGRAEHERRLDRLPDKPLGDLVQVAHRVGARPLPATGGGRLPLRRRALPPGDAGGRLPHPGGPLRHRARLGLRTSSRRAPAARARPVA